MRFSRETRLLPAHGAVQEGHDLASGAGGVRGEGGVGHAVGHLVLHGPGHRLGVERLRAHIREAGLGALRRRGLSEAIQEGHDLASRAGGVRGKRGIGHALRDTLLHGPGHSLGIEGLDRKSTRLNSSH